MRNDPTYEWWEYACHEGNTIVQNYSDDEPRTSVRNPRVEAAAAGPGVGGSSPTRLAGRWVGRPRIATIDYDI